MNTSLHIGGLFAVGFDDACRYMLAVSHSGRGVYDTGTWVKVSRDATVVFPENGRISGIGPIERSLIVVQEKDYGAETLEGISPNNKFRYRYEDGILYITATANQVVKGS